MQRFTTAASLAFALLLIASPAPADQPSPTGNRLTYLDEFCDPYYVGQQFPKLITPQWIGEEGVEAAVVLAIDDMRDVERYETYLRPILDRLKQVDGRAALSIMTNRVDPAHPHLQQWLKEGVTLEVHTYDHPCPLLQGSDLERAKETYSRCVDLLAAVPNNRPVAYRMPCCDSLNTPSPRFWTEIFNTTTEQGHFLEMDSSVFHLFTPADEQLPRELALNDQGDPRFRRYVPFPSFVNLIADYPYPYVISRLCWEFPCAVPSDWEAQHVQQPNNPLTVADMQRAIDATLLKQGVFNLVFHPHGWIRNDQVVELIDTSVARHGSKIRFLNFHEALERINQNLLAGQSLRAADGGDNGVRLLDLDADGFLDVVIGNDQLRQTRLWQPASGTWSVMDFPARIVSSDADGQRKSSGTRFGIISGDVVCLVSSGQQSGAWRFSGNGWTESPELRAGLPEKDAFQTSVQGQDRGVRLRDLDNDDTCELLISNPDQNAVYRWSSAERRWNQLPIELPAETSIVDGPGRDAGLRFVDVDHDGDDDIIFSDEKYCALHLFEDLRRGWSDAVRSGPRGAEGAIPMISRQGTNNGAWFHSDHLWVQNEDTDRLPDKVDRMAFAEMLQPQRAAGGANSARGPMTAVGAAEIDITPDYSVRLSGYGNRRAASEGIAQRIWAKAVAIGGDDPGGPALLINLENCSAPAELVNEVATRLEKTHQIPRERIVVCATHSHTAPHLAASLSFLFPEPLPPEQQENAERYTAELKDQLVRVAERALENRRPAHLAWGAGTVGFAANRRVLKDGSWVGFGTTPEGPVDHSLPLLVARDAHGKPIAIVANYACHCTTLGGDFNQICGDWAGYAQQYLQEDHPGAIAMMLIGCGADANPEPRGGLEVCQQHGRAVAAEVNRLLETELQPLPAQIRCRFSRIELPLAAPPSRDQWQQWAQGNDARARLARHFLERLDRGEILPQTVPYPVGTWTFGDKLAMVFLGGEVVVDYAIRMKEEFDDSRLWITAYANATPCYIASKRILQEGGYEADGSMIYYGQPARLAPETEDLIVDTVQKLLPHEYYSLKKQETFPPPLSPEDSLAAMTLLPGFRAEIVAAEPLVTDPVAFDWGPDGRLWVVEMRDYPKGRDHQGTPGGRVKLLEDNDGDGRYDRATVFLDNLNYPSGVKVWRSGILVTAAPELFYAEDSDGDGVADERRTLYRGFAEGNQQHRVNGMRWGLDNWLYLANGDSGGIVESVQTGESIDIRGRDLRVGPDSGAMEAQSGQTQFGRERDDWGNWFGGNNSNPMWHYVLADHYLRRNSQLSPPDVRHHVSEQPGPAPVFPISRTLERFNDFDRANRFTSACSAIIYRDRLLGDEFVGNSFVCEPVHNLVHREVVAPAGPTFTSRRAAGEEHAEFLASTDNWFRPTMVRTGPDGALWVADMYRFVIEHPQWIPADWQQKLDLLAGDDRGRIYRIFPETANPRPFPRFPTDDVAQLIGLLESPNGWQRDMVQQLLIWRGDQAAVAPLRALARKSSQPLARLHALCTLDGLGGLQPEDLVIACGDNHPGVQRHAIRLAERWLERQPNLAELIARLNSTDPSVEMQRAYSLGFWPDARAGEALGQLALEHADDVYLRAAILSSVNAENLKSMLDTVLAGDGRGVPPGAIVAPLVTVALAFGDGELVNHAFQVALDAGDTQLAAKAPLLNAMLAAVARRQGAFEKVLEQEVRDRLQELALTAKELVEDPQTDPSQRVLALQLAASASQDKAELLQWLTQFLHPQSPPELQSAVVASVANVGAEQVPQALLAEWKAHSPQLREQILEVLLTRPAWTSVLLEHVSAGHITGVDARHRQQLLQHSDAAIQARARELFSETSSSRQAVLDSYQDVISLAGDPSNGKVLFGKHCAVCHRLEDTGNVVGPDLRSLTDKSDASLLIAILDPNRAVEDKYLDYTAATVDGRRLSGILTAETANSITLASQDGKNHVLLRSDIEELQSTGKSLMPEGLEKELPPGAMADLLHYLRATLRAE